jgi:hypothetical protein
LSEAVGILRRIWNPLQIEEGQRLKAFVMKQKERVGGERED